MANIFEKELGIPLPKCCSTGDCCKGASPSTPYHQLMKRAAEGDDFARGFFSIMIPYLSHEEAEKVVPGLVERTYKAAQNSKDFQGKDDLVFYHCRHLTPDNKCGVWEDRPQFCRDYPDTPFIVMAPGCAFEPWAKACKSKYNDMKAEISSLKKLKEELARLKAQRGALSEADGNPDAPLHAGVVTGAEYTKIDAELFSVNNTDSLSLVLSLTDLYVSSPLTTVLL